MQVKFTNITNFNIFYDAIKGAKLPIKTSYNLAKLARAIEEEVQFYREKFRELIFEYAELDENGSPIFLEGGEGVRLKTGSEEECGRKINELQNMEVELPDIKFSFDEFEGVELTLDQMQAALSFFE